MTSTRHQERYAIIMSMIEAGKTALHPQDVQFYLNYCNQNKIVPVHVDSDPDALPVRQDMYRKRYTDIMGCLNKGRSIGATDYQFLRRYCGKTGEPLPPMESSMQFWLKK